MGDSPATHRGTKGYSRGNQAVPTSHPPDASLWQRAQPVEAIPWVVGLRARQQCNRLLPARDHELGATFAGRPAVLWNPLAQASGPGFGVRTNRFGFNITGAANIPIVVEACTNGHWTSLKNCTLTNGLLYFSDSGWTNCLSRFYRIRSP
jgi:hypothetical protein